MVYQAWVQYLYSAKNITSFINLNFINLFIGGPGVHLCVSKLLPRLEENLNLKSKLLMCHRLDEFTTGVMLFATLIN